MLVSYFFSYYLQIHERNIYQNLLRDIPLNSYCSCIAKLTCSSQVFLGHTIKWKRKLLHLTVLMLCLSGYLEKNNLVLNLDINSEKQYMSLIMKVDMAWHSVLLFAITCFETVPPPQCHWWTLTVIQQADVCVKSWGSFNLSSLNRNYTASTTHNQHFSVASFQVYGDHWRC